MNNFPIPSETELQQTLGLPHAPVYHRKGGFKAVFKAENAAGVTEALKAIHIPRAQTEDEKLLRNQLIARAKREIQALGECQSQGIVKLGTVEAKLVHLTPGDYLVYSEEMLPGESLTARLGSKTEEAEFETLKALFLSLVELIGALHALGYLHRDIKPDNVMDTGIAERRFVLLDMGIAYKMQGTDITQGPNPPGTLVYMAPELLGPNYKDSMDFRSEIYSAALTVYVVATRQHPFAPRPEHTFATYHRIMHISPASLANLRPDLPTAFCNIVDRCIKKRPALRYNNLGLLEADIRKA
ncbi:MAG: serine/threonine-protein kinase [Oceanipulchritudo sp.]